MRAYAQSKGWWDGKTEFNFAAVYSYLTTARIESAGSRYCDGKKLLEKRNGWFTQTSLWKAEIILALKKKLMLLLFVCWRSHHCRGDDGYPAG